MVRSSAVWAPGCGGGSLLVPLDAIFSLVGLAAYPTARTICAAGLMVAKALTLVAAKWCRLVGTCLESSPQSKWPGGVSVQLSDNSHDHLLCR